MENLDELRKSIDTIDHSLILLLAKRFRVTQQIGRYKWQHGLPAIDEGREHAQFERLKRLAQEEGLNPELIYKLYRLIIDEVVENHRELQKK